MNYSIMQKCVEGGSHTNMGKRSTQSGKAPEHSSSNILDDAFFMRPSLDGVRVTRVWGEWRMSGLKIIIEKILFAP